MAVFKLTLDGQYLGDPLEWKELSILSSWSEDLFTTVCETGFTFVGDSYEYLVGLYDAGYCTVVEAAIVVCESGSNEVIYEGRIFLSESTINRGKCTITGTVSDIGYNAFIKNKIRQKFFVNIARSSNGSAITAATSTDVTLHDVAAGTDLANGAVCYSAFEVFTFLAAAMSDGVVGFASDFFETGDGATDMITTGLEIRDRATVNEAPEISWDQLYGDLKKIYNLRLWTQDVAGVETIRVEPFWYFRDDSETTEFEDLPDVTEKIDAKQLYSRIKIGSRNSREYDEDTPNTSFTNSSYIGWDVEEYNIAGDCVVDNDLDLQFSELTADSNSVENQINGNEESDKSIFIISTYLAYPGTYKTVQTDLAGTGDSLYNAKYANNSVLDRWNDRIHNTVFRYGNAGGADFEAKTSADQEVFVSCSWGDPPDTCGYGAAVPFDNEISDPGGNYDAVTNFNFTLPAAGTYLFVFDYDVDVLIGSIIGGFTGTELVNTIRTTLYEDVAGAEYAERDFVFTDFRPLTGPLGSPITATKNFQFSQFFAYSGLMGDEVRGYVTFFNNTGLGALGSTATFLTGCTYRSQGLIAAPNSGIKVYQSEVNLGESKWQTIQDNRAQLINLNTNSGYIRSIKWQPFGLTKVETEQVITL